MYFICALVGCPTYLPRRKLFPVPRRRVRLLLIYFLRVIFIFPIQIVRFINLFVRLFHFNVGILNLQSDTNHLYTYLCTQFLLFPSSSSFLRFCVGILRECWILNRVELDWRAWYTVLFLHKKNMEKNKIKNERMDSIVPNATEAFRVRVVSVCVCVFCEELLQ